MNDPESFLGLSESLIFMTFCYNAQNILSSRIIFVCIHFWFYRVRLFLRKSRVSKGAVSFCETISGARHLYQN